EAARGDLRVAPCSFSRQPRQPLAHRHPGRLGRSVWSVIPVLRRGDVGHAPLVAIPPVESIKLDHPKTGAHVAGDNQAIGVPSVDRPTAIGYPTVILGGHLLL